MWQILFAHQRSFFPHRSIAIARLEPVVRMVERTGKTVAVIMVGGPTKGTRFRPLSLNLAKPLFPLAGQPMVHHPILACAKIPNLAQIYLVGFYKEQDFALYVSALSNELRIPVGYLQEDKPRGSAGGLLALKNFILEDDPEHIVVLNCDVCCSFPLLELLEAHKKRGGIGTLLVKQVPRELASEFGELVADEETGELLHYAEKPDTFVSECINCGVYIFTSQIFAAIEDVSTSGPNKAPLRRMSSFEALQSATKSMPTDFIRLDQDILTPLAGKQKLYTYETTDFWEQIKTPGMALRSSSLYLEQYRQVQPELLAKPGDGKKTPSIVGDVYIHPSAKVHPSAKLGPNVSISANARIGPGVRLLECIILDGVEIKENAVVLHSIVGWKSQLGRWSRVQGVGNYTDKLGITILGEDVTVEDEVVVVNCIVLPHKVLSAMESDEIIL